MNPAKVEAPAGTNCKGFGIDPQTIERRDMLDFVIDPFAGTGGFVPADLTERYLPTKQVEFEVVRQFGSIRLWRATETHQVADTKLRLCRYHVTRGECGEAFHIGKLRNAIATFALEVAHG